MPKLPSWTYTIVVLLLLAGIGISRLDYTPIPESGDAAAITETSNDSSQESAPVWSHGADGSSANAEEHWRKHGGEFSQYRNATDYERGAAEFIRNPPPGTQTKTRSNGDTLYYDPKTNTFAVADSRGEPRTYFHPNNGEDYWERQ